MTFNEANTVEQMALTARGDMPPPNLLPQVEDALQGRRSARLTLLGFQSILACVIAQSRGGGIRPLPHQWRDDTKLNWCKPKPLNGGGWVGAWCNEMSDVFQGERMMCQ